MRKSLSLSLYLCNVMTVLLSCQDWLTLVKGAGSALITVLMVELNGRLAICSGLDASFIQKKSLTRLFSKLAY